MKRIERLARRAGKLAVTEGKAWTVTVIWYAEGHWQQQRLPIMDAISYDVTLAYVGGHFFRINYDVLKPEKDLQPVQLEDVQHDDIIVVMNKREGGAAYETVAAIDAAYGCRGQGVEV